jgi:hypothetical protein
MPSFFQETFCEGCRARHAPSGPELHLTRCASTLLTRRAFQDFGLGLQANTTRRHLLWISMQCLIFETNGKR